MANKRLKARLAVRGGGKEHLEKHNLTNDTRSGRFTKKGASKVIQHKRPVGKKQKRLSKMKETFITAAFGPLGAAYVMGKRKKR